MKLKSRTVDEAMQVIAEAVKNGESFSSADLDILLTPMIKISIPENEENWLDEIRTSPGFPRWAILMAAWRMTFERCECPTLPSFVDPRWEEMILAEKTAQAASEKTSEART